MDYEFLDHFPKRMKSVGMHAVLMKNSMQKTTWKQYGIDKIDMQMNLIFAVLLYVMEQSLKEEPCTMDDISSYLDHLYTRYFMKNISYEMSKNLGEFIINVVLCDEGRAMYFDCFDFQEKAFQIQNIRYVANKVIYIDSEVRRTSYYLTDDGYNLLLGTLEIENNMKITIHEMIFKMHLERAAYDKAVDDIKNIFNLLRIQFQKMLEAMRKIRQNALNYSVKDYEEIMDENMEIITNTKKKFDAYRVMVKERAEDLERENIHVRKLDKKEEENLRNLQIIEGYLGRTIDEHQKILNMHFDLKSLYTKELEQLAQLMLIKRFDLRAELYNKVLEDVRYLDHLDYFFRPLFGREIEKTYNLNKALEGQMPIRKKTEEDLEQILEIEDEDYQEEKRRIYEARLRRYKTCVNVILSYALRDGGVTLSQLKEEILRNEEILQNEEMSKNQVLLYTSADLIPTVEIFREVMIEFIKNKTINIEALRQERKVYLEQMGLDFQMNEVILDVVEETPQYEGIQTIEALRLFNEKVVVFENLASDTGRVKRIRCSDIYFTVKGVT